MSTRQPTTAALVTATAAYNTRDWVSAHVEATGQDATLVLRGRADHIGDAARQTMHGGIVAGFLDDAARIWLRALGLPDARPGDFTTEFVRGATASDLSAAVTVVRLGRRVVNLRVDAFQADRSNVVAVGHGIFTLS